LNNLTDWSFINIIKILNTIYITSSISDCPTLSQYSNILSTIISFKSLFWSNNNLTNILNISGKSDNNLEAKSHFNKSNIHIDDYFLTFDLLWDIFWHIFIINILPNIPIFSLKLLHYIEILSAVVILVCGFLSVNNEFNAFDTWFKLCCNILLYFGLIRKENNLAILTLNSSVFSLNGNIVTLSLNAWTINSISLSWNYVFINYFSIISNTLPLIESLGSDIASNKFFNK